VERLGWREWGVCGGRMVWAEDGAGVRGERPCVVRGEGMGGRKIYIYVTVLRNFYFQVLLVRNDIFKGLIATFNVLLHRCIILSGC